jgi:hypothetical protein
VSVECDLLCLLKKLVSGSIKNYSHWKFLDATVFKANSCKNFKAKISEKSEKKGSEYLKRTSESHVKQISVRLLFALKRKKI